MNTPNKAIEVTQADRDAVQAFHAIMAARIMSALRDEKVSKTLGDDEGDAGPLVQAFARHRLRNNTALEMREAAARVAAREADGPKASKYGSGWRCAAEWIEKGIRTLPLSPDPIVTGGWQPITAEAPAISEDVLVWADGYIKPMSAWRQNALDMPNCWWATATAVQIARPTHWMPLPAPPASPSPQDIQGKGE